MTIRDIGKAPESYPPHPCFEGPLGGSADYIYLTTLEITLVVGPTDPPGIVVFELGVTDVNRGLRLAVAVSVEVDPDGNSK